MTNIKVFVVQKQRWHRRHAGDNNNLTFLRTAELKIETFIDKQTYKAVCAIKCMLHKQDATNNSKNGQWHQLRGMAILKM